MTEEVDIEYSIGLFYAEVTDDFMMFDYLGAKVLKGRVKLLKHDLYHFFVEGRNKDGEVLAKWKVTKSFRVRKRVL